MTYIFTDTTEDLYVGTEWPLMTPGDPHDPPHEERVRCCQTIRLIKQLSLQVYIMQTLPRSWLWAEADGVNNAAINVLIKEIEALTQTVNIWDAEMAAYAQEQEILVQRGRRIHSE